VGRGTIDWVKTFTAAKTGGVENYFVEPELGTHEAERRVSQDPDRLIQPVWWALQLPISRDGDLSPRILKMKNSIKAAVFALRIVLGERSPESRIVRGRR